MAVDVRASSATRTPPRAIEHAHGACQRVARDPCRALRLRRAASSSADHASAQAFAALAPTPCRARPFAGELEHAPPASRTARRSVAHRACAARCRASPRGDRRLRAIQARAAPRIAAPCAFSAIARPGRPFAQTSPAPRRLAPERFAHVPHRSAGANGKRRQRDRIVGQCAPGA